MARLAGTGGRKLAAPLTDMLSPPAGEQRRRPHDRGERHELDEDEPEPIAAEDLDIITVTDDPEVMEKEVRQALFESRIEIARRPRRIRFLAEK